MLDLNGIVGTGEGTGMDIVAIRWQVAGAGRRGVFFVELTRASNGTDGVCRFAESEGGDAAVDSGSSSEQLGSIHDCERWTRRGEGIGRNLEA